MIDLESKIVVNISVVIPAHNEARNLEVLIPELESHLAALNASFEICVVDDGSLDDTKAVLRNLQKSRPYLRTINVGSRRGKTHAWRLGFELTSAPLICTLDADLQNNPADIGKLLQKMREGFSFVSGRRRERNISLLFRRLPSSMVNALLKLVTGLSLNDHGCGLKMIRREFVEKLPEREGTHRFIGLWVHALGGTISEVEIEDRPRFRGQSHYGFSRAKTVPFDLLSFFLAHPKYLLGFLSLGLRWQDMPRLLRSLTRQK